MVERCGRLGGHPWRWCHRARQDGDHQAAAHPSLNPRRPTAFQYHAVFPAQRKTCAWWARAVRRGHGGGSAVSPVPYAVLAARLGSHVSPHVAAAWKGIRGRPRCDHVASRRGAPLGADPGRPWARGRAGHGAADRRAARRRPARDGRALCGGRDPRRAAHRARALHHPRDRCRPPSGDRRPATRAGHPRNAHRRSQAAALAEDRRPPEVLRVPAGPSAHAQLPGRSDPPAQRGVREPVPDRQGGRGVRRGRRAGGGHPRRLGSDRGRERAALRRGIGAAR